MRKILRLTSLTALAVACFLLGGAVIYYTNPLAPRFDGRLKSGSLIDIFDDPLPFSSALAIEVYPPDPSNPVATEPYLAYEGGAFVLRYQNSSGSAFKVRVGMGDRSGTYTLYTDNSTYRIPLIYGQGEYTISILEVVSGANYRTVLSRKLSSSGSAPAQAASTDDGWNIDTTNPYLTPVVDINWSADLTSVIKARELAGTVSGEKERARAIYNHLASRMTYQFTSRTSGYTPVMDTAYANKSGICYDIASLYAGMLRSVGVQAKMVTGYNTMVDGYHAWNEVYYDGAWHRVDLSIDVQLRDYGESYGFESPKGSVTIEKSY